MREDLRFNWLDVFRAPRIALSLQKMWVVFFPLFLGYLFYLAFTLLGLATCGSDMLERAWARSGLLVCVPAMAGACVWAYVLWSVGLAGVRRFSTAAGTEGGGLSRFRSGGASILGLA